MIVIVSLSISLDLRLLLMKELTINWNLCKILHSFAVQMTSRSEWFQTEVKINFNFFFSQLEKQRFSNWENNLILRLNKLWICADIGYDLWSLWEVLMKLFNQLLSILHILCRFSDNLREFFLNNSVLQNRLVLQIIYYSQVNNNLYFSFFHFWVLCEVKNLRLRYLFIWLQLVITKQAHIKNIIYVKVLQQIQLIGNFFNALHYLKRFIMLSV